VSSANATGAAGGFGGFSSGGVGGEAVADSRADSGFGPAISSANAAGVLEARASAE
jgi:hypothetical protein